MRTRSKTSLFLMEIVLMLLFFSLSAAVCMQVFAFAQTTADYSRNLSRASFEAQSVAECYKAVAGDLEQMARILDADMQKDNTVILCYDTDWNSCTLFEATFLLTAREVDGLGEITVQKNGEGSPLFTLAVKAVRYGH